MMGASLAFAGLSGCVIQPAEKIVPYVTQPDGLIPGKPLYYATAMTLGGIATGLLARSNEGRPTKIEGNPDHPGSLGSDRCSCPGFAFESLRSRSFASSFVPGRFEVVAGFHDGVRAVIDENRKDGGAGVRFLTETVTSPTLTAQFKQILTELPNAKLSVRTDK